MKFLKWGKDKGGQTPPAAPVSSQYPPMAHVDEPPQPVRAQASQNRATQSEFNQMTVGDYAAGMPRIRVGEFLHLLGRQFLWLIPFMIIATVGAWFVTKDFKRQYTADGTILVQLGSEYLYNSPLQNATQQGVQLTPDNIVLNEIAIFKNPETIEQIAEKLYAEFRADFDKSIFKKRQSLKPGSEKYNDTIIALVKTVDKSLSAEPAPKSSVFHVSYKHPNPQIAIAALNEFIEAYEVSRRKVFVAGQTDLIQQKRQATEDRLRANEALIAEFLSKNGVSDFTSERNGVNKRVEDLRQSHATLVANLAETERALATVEDQLRATPAQLDLQIDDRASQRIAQAELELRQLLAKYLPGSEPVRRKQQELDELKSLQSSYGGEVRGGRRVGPNPVYTALLTRRNTLQSTADALREKEFTLRRQIERADSKVRKLQRLSPEYESLLREKTSLDQALKGYTLKEQEAVINAEQAQVKSENVRVISRSSVAQKGRNMRMIMFALVVVGIGMTLGLVALMRVFLNPALYAANSKRGRRRSDQDGGEGRRSTGRGSARDMASIPAAEPQASVSSGPVPFDPSSNNQPIPEPVNAQSVIEHGHQPVTYQPATQHMDAPAQQVVPQAAPQAAPQAVMPQMSQDAYAPQYQAQAHHAQMHQEHMSQVHTQAQVQVQPQPITQPQPVAHQPSMASSHPSGQYGQPVAQSSPYGQAMPHMGALPSGPNG